MRSDVPGTQDFSTCTLNWVGVQVLYSTPMYSALSKVPTRLQVQWLEQLRLSHDTWHTTHHTWSVSWGNGMINDAWWRWGMALLVSPVLQTIILQYENIQHTVEVYVRRWYVPGMMRSTNYNQHLGISGKTRDALQFLSYLLQRALSARIIWIVMDESEYVLLSYNGVCSMC